MSTLKQLRDAWDAWRVAALPDVPHTWTMDPQPMVLKLPVRMELDGPHTIANVSDRDYRTWSDAGEELITSHRTAVITVRAVSRDHVEYPAELLLERARIALRRHDRHVALLKDADCSVRRVGPSVRYDVDFNGRKESVAAFEVSISWTFTDALQTGPAYGTIGYVELTQTPPGDTYTVAGLIYIVDDSNDVLLTDEDVPLADG